MHMYSEIERAGDRGGRRTGEAAPPRELGTADAERVASTFALLADGNRVRILHALSLVEELPVHDLAARVGMSQSAVSQQLRLLRMSRVVERRKAGRIAYYRLADAHVLHVLADGIHHATEDAGA